MTQTEGRERRAALLCEFEISGLSLAEFCRRAGLEARHRIGPRAAAHRLGLMKKENPTLFAHWYLLRATNT